MSRRARPDGRLLASASDDRSVRLWDAATGGQTRLLEGHTGWVTGVAFSPDGRLLASAGNDRSVRLWNVEGATLVVSVRFGELVTAIALHDRDEQLQAANDGLVDYLHQLQLGALGHRVLLKQRRATLRGAWTRGERGSDGTRVRVSAPRAELRQLGFGPVQPVRREAIHTLEAIGIAINPTVLSTSAARSARRQISNDSSRVC